MSSEPEPFFTPLAHCPKRAMSHQLRLHSRYSFRAIWTEAELLIFGKLRLGLHPKHFERELDKNLRLLNDDDDDYRVLFRSVCQRILNNLQRKGLFKKLPPLSIYGEMIEVPVRKARFQVMMYNQFEDQAAFRKDAMDDEVEQDMVEDDPLDSTCLEILETLHETVTKEVEANYVANRKFLDGDHNELFVYTDAENPFVYDIHQKPWEGPGNKPGRYTVPKDPYIPPQKHTAQDTAAIHDKEFAKPDEESASSISQDSTTDDSASSNAESESSFKSAQTSTTIPSVQPRTPKNKLEQPEFRYEHAGHAFFARPISLGSPTKVNHPLPRGFPAKRSERVEVENRGICLDTYFDLPKDTPEQPMVKVSGEAELGQDEKGTNSERASQTLEGCMSWADDLLRKYHLPKTYTDGDGQGWSNAMDWD